MRNNHGGLRWKNYMFPAGTHSPLYSAYGTKLALANNAKRLINNIHFQLVNMNYHKLLYFPFADKSWNEFNYNSLNRLKSLGNVPAIKGKTSIRNYDLNVINSYEFMKSIVMDRCNILSSILKTDSIHRYFKAMTIDHLKANIYHRIFISNLAGVALWLDDSESMFNKKHKHSYC